MRTPHELLSDSSIWAILHAITAGDVQLHSTASSNMALHAIAVLLPELAVATPLCSRLHVSQLLLRSVYNPTNFVMLPPLPLTLTTSLCTLYEPKYDCQSRLYKQPQCQ